MAGEIDWNQRVAHSMLDNALYSRVTRGSAAHEAAIDREALIALPRV